MMTVQAGEGVTFPIEDLTADDGKVHMEFLSQGARVSWGRQAPMKVIDPYRVAVVRLESGDRAVAVWGGGKRNHNAHQLVILDKIAKVSAWRPNMSQVITESGLTVSWAKSNQCGSCGGLPAPNGYPWDAPLEVAPGGFNPAMVG